MLRARGGSYGLGYDVYRELLRDDQVAACFRQRRLAVVSAEFEVRPGGKMRRDKQTAEFVQAQLAAVDFDSVTDRMLYGVHYGYAVAECLWARDGAAITLAGLRVRSPRRFAFAPDFGLRLLTHRKPDGEALPERKFWTFSTGGESDDEPYGQGLGHELYWPVWFKRNGMRFWAICLDKFGIPTGVGKYPTGATVDQKSKLLDALQAIQSEAGVIIPEGMSIELLEAMRAGTADFEKFVARQDDAIAKIILGQTMTTNAEGGHNKADTAKDVRDQIIKADADLICKSFNLGPGRWITEWNFPGAAVPQVWRKTEQPEDLNTLADREKKIFDMGFKPTLKHVQDTYGGEWEQKQAAPPVDPFLEPAAPAFAEGVGTGTDTVDRQIARLSREAEPGVQQLLAPVRRLLDECIGQGLPLQIFRDRLIELYQDMDETQLAQLLGDAMTASSGAGRFELSQDV